MWCFLACSAFAARHHANAEGGTGYMLLKAN
jgi:hypothetical protein